ncbi:hypothetical protein [Weissella cibaria]|uniref:hypothetical protein n=1 Tax=Weissella cibaria TaxID=137591 RepID=UPI000BFFB90D|nr:hypothetical protein [Weissella cibaria]
MTLKREKIVLTALVGLAATGTLLVQQEKLVEASSYTSGLESSDANAKQLVVNLVDASGNPVTWFLDGGSTISGGTSIEYSNQSGTGMQLVKLPEGILATSVTSAEMATDGQIAMVQNGQLYVDFSGISGSVAHLTLTGTYTADDVDSSAATDPNSVAQSSSVVESSSASSVAPSVSSVAPGQPVSQSASSVVVAPVTVPSSVVTSQAPSSVVTAPSDVTSVVTSEMPTVSSAAVQSSVVIAPVEPALSSLSATDSVLSATPVIPVAASSASMAVVVENDVPVSSEVPTTPTQVILPALATQPAAIVNLPKMAATITPTKQIDWQTPTSASAVIDAAAALQQPEPTTPASATSPALTKSTAQPNAKHDQPNDTTVVKKGSLLSSTADAPKPSMWNDKARTFSALSVGMSALAVAAQMLLSKLAIFKNLLQ